MKKNLIISLGIGIVALLIISFIVGIMEIRKGLAGVFDATQTCHSLEKDVMQMVETLSKGNTVEGKIYDCGQRRGDTFSEYNEILYTIRGQYDPSKSSRQVLDTIGSTLSEAGWTPTGKDRAVYRLTAAPNRMVNATISVISPKHQLYNLIVSTSPGAYTPAGDDKTALRPLVPAVNLHATYASFDFVEPTYQPPGYDKWSRGDPRAWRDGYTPDPRGFTGIVNRYELPGAAAGDDSYRLYQILNEADDAVTQAKYQQLPAVAQTMSNGPVYELQHDSARNLPRSYLMKRTDSFVILSAVGGKDIYHDNFLSISDVVKIFDSLKIKQDTP